MLAAGAVGDVAVWPLTGPAFAGALADPVEAWLRCGPVGARHTVVARAAVVRDGQLVHPARRRPAGGPRRVAARIQHA